VTPSSEWGSRGERLSQVRDQEAAATGTPAACLLDHGGAEIDAHDVGALVEQPFRLRARAAAGVEDRQAGERHRDQPPQRRALQQAVEGPVVSG
jgi:hypothetical protein